MPEDTTDLVRLIARAIRIARAAGKDWTGETEAGVRAVMTVRPDMTVADAFTLVSRMRSEID